jgi:hypothetical protein
MLNIDTHWKHGKLDRRSVSTLLTESATDCSTISRPEASSAGRAGHQSTWRAPRDASLATSTADRVATASLPFWPDRELHLNRGRHEHSDCTGSFPLKIVPVATTFHQTMRKLEKLLPIVVACSDVLQFRLKAATFTHRWKSWV